MLGVAPRGPGVLSRSVGVDRLQPPFEDVQPTFDIARRCNDARQEVEEVREKDYSDRHTASGHFKSVESFGQGADRHHQLLEEVGHERNAD